MIFKSARVHSRVCVGLISSLLAVGLVANSASAASGEVDTSFGGTGIFTTAIGSGESMANASAIQSDNKAIVVGNSTANGLNVITIARYQTNGALDTTFDGDGIATLAAGSSYSSASSVVVQPDGKILIGGVSTDNGGLSQFVIARFTSDGLIDTTFGTDGKVKTSFGSDFSSVDKISIQTDGKILAVGTYESTPTIQIALARYNTDGSLDTTFDSDGKLLISSVSGTSGRDVLVLQDNKILVTEASSLYRLNSDGSLDTSFDGDGSINLTLSSGNFDSVASVLDKNGKIVIAGSSSGSSTDATIVRRNSDGSPDSSFGNNGEVKIPVTNRLGYLSGIEIQKDDKIVASGFIAFEGPTETTYTGTVIRINANGSLDTTFSGDGIFTVPSAFESSSFQSIALQSNGKLIAVGNGKGSTSSDFLVGRISATSSNSLLSGLTLVGASLKETFSSSVTSYTSSVANSVSSITVTPVASESTSSIKVNGVSVASGSASGAVSLVPGTNTITIVVTAEDGTTTSTYTVTVTRALSSNATLQSLSLSTGTLSPTFASGTNSYSVSVGNSTTSIMITPTVTDAGASLKLNGVSTSSGVATKFSLAVGKNTAIIVATAADGVTTQTYTIEITRDVATAKKNAVISPSSLLKSRDIKLSSTSKVELRVKASSKKICTVVDGKLKVLKAGTCVVDVAVTPKATSKTKKPKTTTTKVTVKVK